ncbi:hypothetical protein HNQ43_001330, partial [Faecalicoccus acidiformans]|nr:hypothetical protein [Faecalicoccus acidiformans]
SFQRSLTPLPAPCSVILPNLIPLVKKNVHFFSFFSPCFFSSQCKRLHSKNCLHPTNNCHQNRESANHNDSRFPFIERSFLLFYFIFLILLYIFGRFFLSIPHMIEVNPPESFSSFHLIQSSDLIYLRMT